MTSTNTNPPGLMLPTQKSYTPGAGNPRDSAMMATQQMNNKQASLNAAASGGSRRRIKGGAAPTTTTSSSTSSTTSNNAPVVVPQMKMQYTPQGGPGSNPNDQIKSNSSTSMQSASWAANDKQATKMGGSRKKYKKHKGGNADWKWGCYSGGKKKRTRRRLKKNNKKSKRNYLH